MYIHMYGTICVSVCVWGIERGLWFIRFDFWMDSLTRFMCFYCAPRCGLMCVGFEGHSSFLGLRRNRLLGVALPDLHPHTRARSLRRLLSATVAEQSRFRSPPTRDAVHSPVSSQFLLQPCPSAFIIKKYIITVARV